MWTLHVHIYKHMNTDTQVQTYMSACAQKQRPLLSPGIPPARTPLSWSDLFYFCLGEKSPGLEERTKKH